MKRLSKYLFFEIVSCFQLVLTVNMVHAQDSNDSLFNIDTKYHIGLEEKVQEAFKANQGKTVPALQLAAKSLKNEQATDWKNNSTATQTLWTAQQLYQNRKSAVFLMGRVNQKNINDLPYADLYATAFAISEEGICVTNFHVLSELINSQVADDSLRINGDLSTYFIESVDGEVFVMDKLLAYSSSNDLAIFQVKTGGKKLPFIPMGPILAVGEPVYIISHPDHIYYYLSAGIVNKNSLMLNPRIPDIRQYRMTVSADYAVGSSGAPILSQMGNLAGVVSSTQTIPSTGNPDSKQQMVMKNAISVRALQRLIK